MIKITPFVSPFDYIFCRNVLIYFNNEIRLKGLANLLTNLNKEGYLFIGHTESLINLTENVVRYSNSIYHYLGG